MSKTKKKAKHSDKNKTSSYFYYDLYGDEGIILWSWFSHITFK